MTAESRKQKILEALTKDGSVRVTALSQQFRVSEVTIRNDLADMEYKGLLTRVHGGAVSSYKPYYSMNLNHRLTTNEEGKKVIAKKIAGVVDNNDTLMLNSGTTTLMIFRALPQNLSLNIVTNSVSIALEAADHPNFNVLLLGGQINSKYQFTYGGDAVCQLRQYHADKVILSIDGIDIASGFSTFYDKEAEIDRVMLEQANTSFVAADFSKLNRTAFTKISDLSVADYIVTDRSVPSKLKREVTKQGVGIL